MPQRPAGNRDERQRRVRHALHADYSALPQFQVSRVALKYLSGVTINLVAHVIAGFFHCVADDVGIAARRSLELVGGRIRVRRGKIDLLHVQVQGAGHDLGENGVRTLADIDRAAVQSDTAILVQQHVCPGPGQAADMGEAGHADAAFSTGSGRFPVQPFINPAGGVPHLFQAGAHGGLLDGLAAEKPVILLQCVVEAQLQRVYAQLVRQVVQLRFTGKSGLGITEAAEGAGAGQVGIHRPGFHPHVRNAVRALAEKCRHRGDFRAFIGVGAAVKDDPAVARDQGSILPGAGLHVNPAAMTALHHGHVVFAGESQLDRPPGSLRQQRGDGLVGELALAAETAADARGDDPHLRHGQTQRKSGIHLHAGDALG